jgi:hypothetical protein
MTARSRAPALFPEGPSPPVRGVGPATRCGDDRARPRCGSPRCTVVTAGGRDSAEATAQRERRGRGCRSRTARTHCRVRRAGPACPEAPAGRGGREAVSVQVRQSARVALRSGPAKSLPMPGTSGDNIASLTQLLSFTGRLGGHPFRRPMREVLPRTVPVDVATSGLEQSVPGTVRRAPRAEPGPFRRPNTPWPTACVGGRSRSPGGRCASASCRAPGRSRPRGFAALARRETSGTVSCRRTSRGPAPSRCRRPRGPPAQRRGRGTADGRGRTLGPGRPIDNRDRGGSVKYGWFRVQRT